MQNVKASQYSIPFEVLRMLLLTSPPDASSSFYIQNNFMFGHCEFSGKLWDLQEATWKRSGVFLLTRP